MKEYEFIILATGYTTNNQQIIDPTQYKKLTTIKPPKAFGDIKSFGYDEYNPITDGRGQSLILNSIYFPSSNVGIKGGLTFGIYSWNIGEKIAVQLGTINESERTLNFKK